MIRLFHANRPAMPADAATDAATQPAAPDELRAAIWIDLDCPTEAERANVEATLSISLPTADDLREIEASSRVYREDGALYMTAQLVSGMDSGSPVSRPVGFVISPAGQLITIRHATPRAFQTAITLATRAPIATTGQGALLRLLDLIVDRLADVLEQLGLGIDETGASIFGEQSAASRSLTVKAQHQLLREIGKNQYALNKVHESLQTLSRVISFLTVADAESGKSGRAVRETLKSLSRDISSLTESSTFAMQNVAFLLDAAVGRISIEQNVIMKILSMASIMLMPPTLIAGIYGMNFHFMPELQQPLAYPVAVLIMLLSAWLPLWYCRRKGWL